MQGVGVPAIQLGIVLFGGYTNFTLRKERDHKKVAILILDNAVKCSRGFGISYGNSDSSFEIVCSKYAYRVRGSNPVLAELLFQPVFSENFRRKIFGDMVKKGWKTATLISGRT